MRGCWLFSRLTVAAVLETLRGNQRWTYTLRQLQHSTRSALPSFHKAMPADMRRSFRRCCALALCAAVLAACEPVFVFAGGRVGGVEEAPPANWGFAESVDTVQVETRPADPYSVNVWGVGVGARFYVAASDGADARWAQAIKADSRVRLKVGERVFPLAAERVLDAAELNDVAAAYAAKYDTDREQSFVDAAWVYRLSPR